MRIRCKIIEPQKLQYQILEQEEAWYSIWYQRLSVNVPPSTARIGVRSVSCPSLVGYVCAILTVYLRGMHRFWDDCIVERVYQSHDDAIKHQRAIIIALLAQARILDCPFSLEA